jgi:hypothetical protein
MKKVFAILLAVCAMSVVLTGCSKAEEGTDATTTTGTTGETKE